jgi:hypothetical protein
MSLHPYASLKGSTAIQVCSRYSMWPAAEPTAIRPEFRLSAFDVSPETWAEICALLPAEQPKEARKVPFIDRPVLFLRGARDHVTDSELVGHASDLSSDP